MKTALVLLAVLALGYSAPQPRKLFHEHFEEILDVIKEEAGHHLDRLLEHYMEFKEFWVSLDYMKTSEFQDLVYKIESLPECKAVFDFLENNNIDIVFFIDLWNEWIETVPNSRHQLSGEGLSSFIKDAIAEFPKAKLVGLYDQKMSEDEAFRIAIENLQSDEWDQVWSALWENETFLIEVDILLQNGIDLKVLLEEIIAIFGQTKTN